MTYEIYESGFAQNSLRPAGILDPFPNLAPDLLNRLCMLDRVAGQLERYMDLLSARQKLVASNVANADTPGYITKDLDFQGEFQSAAGFAPNVVEANRGYWRKMRCVSNWHRA